MNQTPVMQNTEKSPGIKVYLEDPKIAVQRRIKRSVIIIVIAAIITGLVIFLMVLKIKDVSKQMSEKQNLIYLSLQNSVISAETQNNWQEIAPYSAEIKRALPPATDLLTYQGTLEQAAVSAGVQISVNFAALPKAAENSPANQKKTLSGVDHTIEVKGNLANINQFIENLENIPYYVLINSFNITSQQGINKEASANMNLKVYTK